MRKAKLKPSFLLACALFLFPELFTYAQYFGIDDVFRIRTVAEVAVSPTGEYVAFTVNVPRPFNHQPGSDYRELYLYHVSSGNVLPFITGNKVVLSPGWTPDGSKVVFRATLPQQKGLQVYAMSLKGGEPVALTKHATSIIQYTFINNKTLAFTAEEALPADEKKIRDKGLDLEIFEEDFRHINLYTIDLDGGQAIQRTSGVTVFDFAIAPGGDRLALAVAPRNLVDDDFMFRRIHILSLIDGKLTSFIDNPGKLGKMAFSPDGKHLAFLSASHLHDAVVGSLFVAKVANPGSFDQLPNYMQGMRASALDFTWKDSGSLIIASEEGVDVVLSEHRIGEKQRRILMVPGKAVFQRFSFSKGIIAFSGSTPWHPAELFTGELRKRNFMRVTNHNNWLNDIRLARQEKITYFARDGLDIEGILVYPIDYDTSVTYPLIVYIHGGPEAANLNGWLTNYSSWGQVAAAQGYFVFYPNYRAGSGRGVDFTMQGFGDLLGKEYDDVLDGIDYLIANGMVDRNRVGIGGGSYGGYFAAWSATRHTERFATAVVFVGIANQVSKRNTTDIPMEDYLVHWGFWTHEDHERVYGVSPVKYAHLSQTPTLILHGKEDTRIPASQGLELYRAMKLHSKAPVRLVFYPGEGHGNRKNINRFDFLIRTMEWFNHYLKNGDRNTLPPKYYDIPE